MNKPVLNIGIKYVANNPNNVIITDSTDYTALGLDSTKVKINTKIYLPTGTLYVPAYYNTPAVTNDFSPAVPFNYRTKLGSAAIPDFLLDSHGCFINGLYKVEVKWYYVDTAETFDYSYEQNIIFKKPEIKIVQKNDCFCANFKSTDKTDYTGTTEVSYSHTINYPAETNEDDIVTTLKDYTDARLANGTYVTEINTERIITISTVFSVQCVIYGKQSMIVDCDSVCDIKCGINNLNKAYEEACGKNLATSKELKEKINDVLRYYQIIYINNSCGGKFDVDSYIQKIKAILGDCNCGCTDCGDDIWVSGVCGSSGGSAFDPSGLITIINNINNSLTNLINELGDDVDALEILINQIANKSWFDGLITTCLQGFPVGVGVTEEQKKQFIIDTICQILGEINKPPVAKNDFSVILQNQNIEKLVTQNDFFTSNVTVTIVSAPLNGTATILPDGKTIKYIPNIGWSGIDSITYKITDQYGQFSTAIWQISVNAVASVGCAVVVPGCISEALPTNDNKVQFIITNTSALNGNVLLSEDYIINIYDISNTIIRSYPVAGSPTSDPTVFVSTHVIANTWNYFKVQQQISTGTTTGGTCGTVLFETEAYSLTDINTDIFAGTTAPCLGFSPTDTQQQKIQKLLNKLCAEYNISTTNGLNGVGSPLSPIKLGGELTQNTTIDGDKELNLLIRALRLIQYDENSTYYNLLEVQNKKKYNNTSDFANFNVAISGNKKSIIDGVFNLSTIGTALEANYLSHDIEFINNTSSLDKSGVSVIGYGDVCNLSMGFGAQSTEAGHIDSMRNLTLPPIFKGNNSTPFTVDKYVSIAIMDLTQSFGTPSDWVIPTDRYAILQEGATDKNEFYGEIRYHSGLTNVSDIRSKKVIRKFEKGLDVVLNINPIVFKRLEHFGNSEIEQIGIIAQELEKVVPEIVNTSKQTIVTKSELINNENTGKVERKILEEKTIDDFKTYTPEALHFILINAIKELSAKNKELEERIIALENK